MANELNISGALRFVKSPNQTVESIATAIISITGTKYVVGVQSIGTSDEVVAIDDIGTAGFCLVKNLDSSNYIEIGADGTTYPIKLLAGEFALFRINGTLHAKANTAACNLQKAIIEA